MEKKKKKPFYICQSCGKKAVYNLQNAWKLYDIIKDVDFELNDEWEGETNDFYCSDCYENNKFN